jgi:hypothetical protein
VYEIDIRYGSAGRDRGYRYRSCAHPTRTIVIRLSTCFVPEFHPMIDTLSLLLSHFLMLFVIFKVMNNPDLNAEPTPYGRRFKTVGPRA